MAFPQRLTLDAGGVGNGTASPAQSVLGLHATLGRELPRRLEIYAFGARASSYAHNDPAAAYPRNGFAAGLVRFLRGLGRA